jgi:hypothetical protein
MPEKHSSGTLKIVKYRIIALPLAKSIRAAETELNKGYQIEKLAA